jgi:hypothetical protein
MTKNQAIRLARKRVTLVGFGRGEWAVHWRDEARDATWHSEHMDYAHACAYRRAALLEEALELLGVEEAGMHANVLAECPGRWDELLPDSAPQRTCP